MSSVAGPIIGSYLGQTANWRWAFGLPAILADINAVLFLTIYRETCGVKILARKMRALRAETGNAALYSKYNTDKTARQLFAGATIRPLRFLFTASMLTLITLNISVSFGMCYIALTNISSVFQRTYRFSEGASGLAFVSLGI